LQAPGARDLQRPINEEAWFHGQVRREVADAMLKKDGDFMVRESAQSRGQYILTALQDVSEK
jgi:SHC-transforming protein 1